MDDIKVLGILLTVVSAVKAKYCSYYTDAHSWISTNTASMNCPHGCCGDMYNRYCCEYSAVGAIVGIVIGCICAVILIVSVVIAICCCLKKSRGQSGQVCQPAQPGVNIAYGVPNSAVAYGAPVGYNNTGFMQTTTMTAGTVIPQQQPMQPNPYAQAPPKYEELNIPPQQQQPN